MQASDTELMERAARGDGQAFHALVDRHAAALYRLACALVGSPVDAEDVLQEALAGAFRGLRGFEGRSSVRTWLGQIVARQAAAFRRYRRVRQTTRLEGGAEPIVPGGEGRVDRHEDVRQALAKLSDEHREVVVLREFGGLSYEEIAEALGLPRGTVESRLHRARRELREYLGAYGPDSGRAS